jgi:hypothetical protein
MFSTFVSNARKPVEDAEREAKAARKRLKEAREHFDNHVMAESQQIIDAYKRNGILPNLDFILNTIGFHVEERVKLFDIFLKNYNFESAQSWGLDYPFFISVDESLCDMDLARFSQLEQVCSIIIGRSPLLNIPLFSCEDLLGGDVVFFNSKKNYYMIGSAYNDDTRKNDVYEFESDQYDSISQLRDYFQDYK